MKALIPAALLAALLGGCASFGGDQSADKGVREVTFVCERGEPVLVRFHTQPDKAVLVRSGTEVELPAQVTASGYWYTNGPVGIRGKGDAMSLELGRMVPIQCQAQ